MTTTNVFRAQIGGRDTTRIEHTPTSGNYFPCVYFVHDRGWVEIDEERFTDRAEVITWLRAVADALEAVEIAASSPAVDTDDATNAYACPSCDGLLLDNGFGFEAEVARHQSGACFGSAVGA